MQKKFIFLNGPAGCGKDTLGELLMIQAVRTGHGAMLAKLAQPLREIGFALVPGFNDKSYGKFKQHTHAPFGITGRQIMIDASEKFLKQVYGPDIMSQLLLAHNAHVHHSVVHIVTDSGFQSEIDYFQREGHDVVLANIHRPGYDFTGDSREWVRSPHSHRESFHVDNSGGLDYLEVQARHLWAYARRELGL